MKTYNTAVKRPISRSTAAQPNIDKDTSPVVQRRAGEYDAERLSSLVRQSQVDTPAVGDATIPEREDISSDGQVADNSIKTVYRYPFGALEQLAINNGETGFWEEKDGQQNAFVDIGGWVSDLIKALGWSVGTGFQGRADAHLLHNMFGSGGPLTVTREWVMDAPDWKAGYEQLTKNLENRAKYTAKTQVLAGNISGTEHIVEKSEYCSKPPYGFPWNDGADQFWGSGCARISIEADYSWQVSGNDRDRVEIEFKNVRGIYEDYYVWEHQNDPGQYSRQRRGWYTPFSLNAEWTDPDRFVETGVNACISEE
ncbi:MAG: hypothetical protein V2B20_09560 [Pseudomonadota bacterium]